MLENKELENDLEYIVGDIEEIRKKHNLSFFRTARLYLKTFITSIFYLYKQLVNRKKAKI